MVTVFQNTCRTCLQKNSDAVSVNDYTVFSNPKATYAEILKDIARLEFNDNPKWSNMPQQLCFVCCSQLRKAYVFVKQARESQEKLNKSLDTQNENPLAIDQGLKQEKEIEETLNTMLTNIAETASPITPFMNISLENDDSGENDMEISLEEVQVPENSSYFYDISDKVNKSFKEDLEENNKNMPTRLEANSDNEYLSINNDVDRLNINENSYDNLVLKSKHNLLLDSDEETIKSPKNLLFKCDLCPREYNDKYKLRYHLIYKHQIDYKSIENRKEKNVTAEKKVKFKCRSCDYKGNSAAALHYHIRSKHGTEEDKYTCKFCPYTNLKKFSLLGHIKSSHLSKIKALKAAGKYAIRKLKKNSEKPAECPMEFDSDNYSSECSTGDEDVIRKILNIKKRKPKDEQAELKNDTCSKKTKCTMVSKVFDIPENLNKSMRLQNNEDEELFKDHNDHNYHNDHSDDGDLKNDTCSKEMECTMVPNDHNDHSDDGDLKNNTCSKEMECTMVPNVVDTPENLNNSMQLHHNENEKLFSDHNDLSNQELKQTTYACKQCPRKFSDMKLLKIHLKNKHNMEYKDIRIKYKKISTESKVYKCQYCEYTGNSAAAAHFHVRSKHGSEEDKFKCFFCEYSNFKKFSLLKHIKKTHLSRIKILKQRKPGTDSIDDLINLIPYLEENNENENEEVKKRNEDSDASDASDDEDFIRDILKMQKRGSKLNSAKKFAIRCDECGNVYKDSKALNTHKRNVHGVHSYKPCPQCHRKYKRSYDLKRHIVHAHTPNKKKIKPTPKVKEKRFMCTECSYVCTTSTMLTIHTSRHHTGERPHKCNVCSKSFVVAFDLKTHSYLHTGERPFKCPVCSKGFRDRSHMLKHQRIHSDEKPYNCSECGKGFSKNYNLTTHKRIHMKGQKLNCTVCGKFFKDRAQLNIHQINEFHHSEAV